MYKKLSREFDCSEQRGEFEPALGPYQLNPVSSVGRAPETLRVVGSSPTLGEITSLALVSFKVCVYMLYHPCFACGSR